MKAILIDQYVHAVWEEEVGLFKTICGYTPGISLLDRAPAIVLAEPFEEAYEPPLKCRRCTMIIVEVRTDAY